MKHHLSTHLILPLSLLIVSSLTQADEIEEIEEIIVTADFHQTPVLKVNGSVSVFDADTIQQRSADHLEQLFNLAPNVNYASGASRGRYIQIRGIGERSQFIDPVNPSVGVIIDGIDFTGISTAASLLDIAQVEILRGPQGTLYGANALAGLINIVSNTPGDVMPGILSLDLGEYGTQQLSAASGGTISETVSYRIAAKNSKSDGYINNTHLNRKDTNNIDESTFRAKIKWQADEDLTIDFTTFFADIDNGYDAFSLDNNRNTLSDQPGTDAQNTWAAAIKASWQINTSTKIITNASHASSELVYAYDEDWAYPALCTDFSCLFGPDSGYSSEDQYLRDNTNKTLDIKAITENHETGTQWVSGIYLRQQQVDLTRIYTFANADFSSQYDTDNLAIYGQLDQPLTQKIKVIAGLRLENYQADYTDSEGFNAKPEENLVGGKLGLEYQLNDKQMLYGTISRGYKPGGFNANNAVPEQRREFDAEFMWNYEAGLKGRFIEDKLQVSLAVFFQDRQDIQAKQYFIIQQADLPPQFVDFIDNAASGSNYGLEAELMYQLNESFSVFASLGLLRTQFDDFSYFDADGNETVKDGRDQAHAPHYQYAVGGDYHITHSWMLHIELEGKDEFYFSDSHDQKSDAYNLINARLNYSLEDWEFAIWARNLTDETYQVRGFEFGNDPRDGYATHSYNQLGEPRIFGVSAKYYF